MKIIIVMLMLLFANAVLAGNVNNEKSFALYDSKIKILENRVKEIRQGQLNYKIEKTLIKDAYSSNLETLNLVITIVLAVFSVLGFIGVKSIYTLRNQFQSELDVFKGQRRELDQKLTELKNNQSEVKSLMETVSEENKNQDLRLKILEIQEKSSSLINQNDPKRALKYIAVGLEKSPDDIVLLAQKQKCYFKLAQFDDALTVTELIIEADENTRDQQITNVAEMNLFLERYETFNDIFTLNKKEIEKRPYLAIYFKILKFYLSKDNENFINSVTELVTKLPTGNVKSLNWGFDEVKMLISKKPDTKEKNIFLNLLLVLDGKTDKKNIVDILIVKVEE